MFRLATKSVTPVLVWIGVVLAADIAARIIDAKEPQRCW